MSRAGVSYFGVRILRHVRRDLQDIASRGYTAVLHTFSENDLAYYRGTMADIVATSHELGLEVQMCPWGLGRTFGGEAESRWVTFHPDACQVLDDGRRVPTGCLNNPTYRAFCREWADAALEAGTDYVFWDEPHWTVPEHVGVEPERWACCCDVCRELAGGDPTPDFREASLVNFLREMVAHVASRGGRNTVCLLPLTEGPHGISDWDSVAALPGLAVLATDPYWKNFDETAELFVGRNTVCLLPLTEGPHGISDWDSVASIPDLAVLATDPYWKNFDETAELFVGRFARLLAETAARHGVEAQLWLPSFGLTREDIPDLEAAVAASRAAGIEDLWTWGYEACGHMTHLATPDSPIVWEAITKALTGAAAATERERVDLRDLDLRPTAELVRLINKEDQTVAEAVGAEANSIAAVIDAVVQRLEAGGRLVYAGAGSSGRIASGDADECGPTFSTSQVVAVTTEEEAAEDDGTAGANDVVSARVGTEDVVLGISASGHTPYTLGAIAEAARAGALTVGLACVRDSELARRAELAIEVEVGPEVIAGSTRMKAGTAQKLVLNAISTIAMVQLGKTFGNLMVDVQASNEKLRARARRAVAVATAAPEEEVAAAIAAAEGDAKVAIVSLLAGVDAQTARSRLTAARGVIREAVEDVVG